MNGGLIDRVPADGGDNRGESSLNLLIKLGRRSPAVIKEHVDVGSWSALGVAVKLIPHFVADDAGSEAPVRKPYRSNRPQQLHDPGIGANKTCETGGIVSGSDSAGGLL